MATPVPFTAIAEALRDAFLADAEVAVYQPTIRVETWLDYEAERSPFVGIYALRYRLPAGQPIAAMTRGLVEIDYAIGVAAWSSEDFATAAATRDALLGRLHLAYLTLGAGGLLGGAVTCRMPTGGDLPSVNQRGNPLIAAGDFQVTVETRMVTD